jgi:hypothetical protein
MGIVRRQKMHVYVQQSSKITLPFNPFIERGSELAHPVTSLNSGAGVAGMISIPSAKESTGYIC